MPSVNDIIRFIAFEVGEPESRLSLETRLLHDLDIAGDDADLLFATFAERFGVDLAGLDLSSHFPSEYLWFSRDRSYRPITIGDLLMAAETKTWQCVQATNAVPEEKD